MFFYFGKECFPQDEGVLKVINFKLLLLFHMDIFKKFH